MKRVLPSVLTLAAVVLLAPSWSWAGAAAARVPLSPDPPSPLASAQLSPGTPGTLAPAPTLVATLPPAQPVTVTVSAVPTIVSYGCLVSLRASLISSGGPLAESNAGVVRVALAQLGKPYQWGASGPNSFDCSGLTMYCYRQIGVDLPHSSADQYHYGVPVPRPNLLPGDLVFFYQPIHHVGIYLGNGSFVHAPSTGDVVKISSLAERTNYTGAVRPTRRVLTVLRSSSGVSWVPAGRAAFSSRAYRATVRLYSTSLLRLRFAGDETYSPATSTITTVGCRAYLPRPAAPALVTGTGPVIVSGLAKPSRPATITIDSWIWTPSPAGSATPSRWVRRPLIRVPAWRSGSVALYSAAVPLSKGQWRVRAIYSGPYNVRTYSPYRRFRAY